MAEWYTEQSYRKKITLQASKISGSHTNIPFLFQIETQDTDINAVANSDGTDILFTTSDKETRVPHEIEHFKNGSGNIWVKAPSLTHNTSEDFYIYYGDNTDHTNDAGYMASGVWDDNYVGVWHMNDATTSTISDSTKYNNDGTKGAAGYPSSTKGYIGSAQRFSNDNLDKIECGQDSSLVLISGITIEAWGKVTNDDDNYRGILSKKSSGDWSTKGYSFNMANNGTLLFKINGNEGESNTVYDLSNNYRYFVASWQSGTQDINTLDVYVDGIEISYAIQNNYSGNIDNSSIDLRIGQYHDNSSFSGQLDEVKLSNTKRSVGWWLTHYRSMSSNSSFISLASQEESGATAPAGDYSFFNSSVGSATGWTWISGQFNSNNGMRAISATPTNWSWELVSSSSILFFPSGSPTGWVWVSGSYQGGGV